MLFHAEANDRFMRHASRRSVVHSSRGVVTSSQPLASSAGVKVLDAGGNAMDAAVATAAALNVTEPCSTGIGGDCFVLYYSAKDGRVHGLNASGRSPKALTRELVLETVNGDSIPHSSIHSVTIPGAAAGWCDAVAAFGNLQMSQILAPAIRLAENGFPVHHVAATQWQRSEVLLKNASANADEMFLNGRAPREGEIMFMPHLAQTFRELGDSGKDAFYKGRIAQEIVALVQRKGGVMTMEDLAQHSSEFVEPLTYTYANEYVVHECPPNGQGITALIALGILESCERQGLLSQPLLELPHNGTEYLHYVIESLRLAFAETRHHVCDPTTTSFNYKTLLTPEYLDARARLIQPKRTTDVKHSSPEHSSDTVYFTVADEHGNVASFINSNYAGFGTGAIPRKCGFTLQNRGTGFSLDETHPNVVAGGKRPFHTIIPAICTRVSTNDVFMSWSVMGGYNQPQGQLQTFLNVLRGFSAQEAVDASRLCIGATRPTQTPMIAKQSHLQSDTTSASEINTEVNIEEGVDDHVIRELQDMGHCVTVVRNMQRQVCGRGQIIVKTNPRVWSAGSDMRADGCAIAQV
ncbi:hypothetical protein E3P99_00685 [Wallemia hederae]|uniref:Gamma-glutamyltransferase n=1 Tax=Wallemia hederae TaxID=1540922 RepID=A0A4T0FW31_9BASI|nr:hypothetical protein E3P99_00685 [Wallemia hederae]